MTLFIQLEKQLVCTLTYFYVESLKYSDSTNSPARPRLPDLPYRMLRDLVIAERVALSWGQPGEIIFSANQFHTPVELGMYESRFTSRPARNVF